jgi:chemotaxis protein methyltransferase CheR
MPRTGELAPVTFARLARLIYENSRLYLAAEKRQMLANRLRPRLAQLNLGNFEQYYELLLQPQSLDEQEVLIELVAIHHSHFFRELTHFQFLAQTIVPGLSDRLQRQGGSLRIWSAATAFGQEAYSIGITLAQCQQMDPGLRCQLTASDISRRALQTAQRAIYSTEALDGVPTTLLHQYFQRGQGPQHGHCRVRPELRQQIRFERINLFQRNYPFSERFHVIFCRNVMIYFDEPARQEALARMAECLEPGGYLIVGCSEALMSHPHRFQPLSQGVYRL